MVLSSELQSRVDLMREGRRWSFKKNNYIVFCEALSVFFWEEVGTPYYPDTPFIVVLGMTYREKGRKKRRETVPTH